MVNPETPSQYALAVSRELLADVLHLPAALTIVGATYVPTDRAVHLWLDGETLPEGEIPAGAEMLSATFQLDRDGQPELVEMRTQSGRVLRLPKKVKPTCGN